MMNKMDWKAWLGLIVIVMIISGIVSGLTARAETTMSTDVEIVEETEPVEDTTTAIPGDDSGATDAPADDTVTDTGDPADEASQNSPTIRR